jgi:hypothetical protein
VELVDMPKRKYVKSCHYSRTQYSCRPTILLVAHLQFFNNAHHDLVKIENALHNATSQHLGEALSKSM